MIQSGPDAIAKNKMLNIAFDEWPDKIDPELSRINHNINPVRTDFRIGYGAIS